MKILYFAWVRTKTGIASEIITTDAKTIGELIEHLIQKSSNYKDAFSDLKGLCFSVNQTFATLETQIKKGDEIAFFPPVTGG